MFFFKSFKANLIGFCDLLGNLYAPVSKIPSVKKNNNQTFDQRCHDKCYMHKVMAGLRKKLRYSEEIPWFSE